MPRPLSVTHLQPARGLNGLSRQTSRDSSDTEWSTGSGEHDEYSSQAAVGGLASKVLGGSGSGAPSAARAMGHKRSMSESGTGGRHAHGHTRSDSLGSNDGGSAGRRAGRDMPPRIGTPPMSGFVTASMDDQLLEVVAVEGVLQLGLAQMALTNAHRLCQCSTVTITSRSTARLPMQVDGEPFELEPIFAPRKPMSITVSHHNQAVMLSRSQVRSDGVALEAIDWAMQEGVINVEQRNQVVREIARRTGSLQRRALSTNASNLSLPSLVSG